MSVSPKLMQPMHNLRTLNTLDFKLCTLININMEMIPIAQWIKVKAIFYFVAEGRGGGGHLCFTNISCLLLSDHGREEVVMSTLQFLGMLYSQKLSPSVHLDMIF